ncbi:MAG: cytochrome P450, partial [Caulobacter sp.]
TRTEGAWVPTRNDDIRAVLQDPETFSSEGSAGFAELIGESWPLIPTAIDPPDHSVYRAALNPLFSPVRMRRIEDQVHQRAEELLAPLLKQSSFDFVKTFGAPFPISIFLELMGLPSERLWEFHGWVDLLLHGATITHRQQGARSIIDYLRSELEARKNGPRDDVMTYLTTCKVFDRLMTDDELIGTAMLLFGGGIDTVASSLGFYFLHLAQHPKLQDRIKQEPGEIPNLVEEFLRAFAIVAPHRKVTRDVEFAGVQMKAGDWVMCSTILANTDPEAFPDPLTVDPVRQGDRHATFSFGPHRCLGSHLARRELAIALETWSKSPPFKLDPSRRVEIHGGGLVGVDSLPLMWA